MQIESKKDIVYFAVDNISRWEYDNIRHFLDKRIGHEITMHVGHKDGFCMCHHHNHTFASNKFGFVETIYYPCVYITAQVDSITDVEPVDKYEGSVDFTLGNQHRKLMNIKTIIVGVKINKAVIQDRIDYLKGEKHLLKPGRTVDTKISDMSKVFGVCIPSYASSVFWMEEWPKRENDYLTNRDVSTHFTSDGMTARFIGGDYEGRLSDYSIDSNYKYHTILCS